MSSVYQEETEKAINALKRGQVILHPTDTVWGLGCDMTNKNAVHHIYKIKNRDRRQPFIILVDSISMLKFYVKTIHPRIETLLINHLQPLTIVYDQVQNIPEHLMNEHRSLAIRVCLDDFCRDLIHSIDRPIVSTSANVSGTLYPRNFSEISDGIIKQVDHIVKLKHNDMDINEPSIVATYDKKGELEFIRM